MTTKSDITYVPKGLVDAKEQWQRSECVHVDAFPVFLQSVQLNTYTYMCVYDIRVCYIGIFIYWGSKMIIIQF